MPSVFGPGAPPRLMVITVRGASSLVRSGITISPPTTTAWMPSDQSTIVPSPSGRDRDTMMSVTASLMAPSADR